MLSLAADGRYRSSSEAFPYRPTSAFLVHRTVIQLWEDVIDRWTHRRVQVGNVTCKVTVITAPADCDPWMDVLGLRLPSDTIAASEPKLSTTLGGATNVHARAERDEPTF
jgi:hypothetical protein